MIQSFYSAPERIIMTKTALIIDFDGTITDDDFFVYIRDAYFDDTALEPWRRYLDGKLTHFDALKQIFAKLRVSEDELKSLIATVQVDPWTIPLFRLCHSANIPVYIASAGCDYYINLLIGEAIQEYNVTLITNRSAYSKAAGLVMESPPQGSLYYDASTGISKRKIAEILKADGYHIIFAGDGPPDIEPARLADVVFAKKILLDKCIEEGIPIQTFNSCQDIYSFISTLLESETPQ